MLSMAIMKNYIICLERIRMKYSPDFEETGKKYEKAAEKKVDIYEIQIENISGKARKK